MSYVFDAEYVKTGFTIVDSANWLSFQTHRRCDGAQNMRLTAPNNAVKVDRLIEPETMRYERELMGNIQIHASVEATPASGSMEKIYQQCSSSLDSHPYEGSSRSVGS